MELQKEFKDKYEKKSKVKEWIILTALVKAIARHKSHFEYFKQVREYAKFKDRCA